MSPFKRVVLPVVVLAALSGCSPARDAHAEAACAGLVEASHQGLLDAVITSIKAVHEASLSSDSDLKAAAAKTSPASELDPNNPLYENPGDVQVNAVSAWCDAHPA